MATEVYLAMDQQATDVLRIYRENDTIVVTKHAPVLEEREKVLLRMSIDEARVLYKALKQEVKR
jgi:hypothetical protein